MEKEVTKIDALAALPTKLRVAAYARVSSGKEAMLQSLSAQISYYNRMIQEHEDWIFVGVYSDEAFTGTKDTREGFQNLVKDALDGKIDLIITKAISRFARNTLTLLETVRELKKRNINVYFEEEKIFSMSNEGEMLLTALASVAQEQSRSTSENMLWRIRKDMESGILWGGSDCMGYKLINRHYVIDPETAEVVKRIFHMYIEGNGALRIAKALNKDGIKSYTGIEWGRTSVMQIINNVNYTGDLLLQKTYRENYLTKKTKLNKGEHNQYLVENDHEPIITKAVFNEAQRILKARSRKIVVKPNAKPHLFSGLLFCGDCGTKYRKKENSYRVYWLCSRFEDKGKESCASRQIRNDVLEEATKTALGLDTLDETTLKRLVGRIEIFSNANKLVFHLNDGGTVEYEYPEYSRKSSWTPEMKEKARLKALEQHERSER